MSSVLGTFLTLVKISSPSGNEDTLRQWLMAWSEKHGFHSHVDQTGNLIVTKTASEFLPFFLCAHMDTVQPGENIRPKIQNGMVVSNGSTILGADNKASIAAILCALEEWQEVSDRGFQVVFTVKEETGGGADFLDTSLLRSKIGYIFDYAQPLGSIILQAPYITNFEIYIQGISSHACFPENGISVLPILETLLQKIPTGKQASHNTYLNIGKIEVGSAINTVPGLAKVQGEVRSFEKDHFTLILEDLKKLTNHIQGNGITTQFHTSGYCPGYVHEKSLQAITTLSKVLSESTCEPKFVPSFGVSDANSLNNMGFTVITASDGVQNPHTTEERIAVKDLVKLKEVVLRLLKESL